MFPFKGALSSMMMNTPTSVEVPDGALAYVDFTTQVYWQGGVVPITDLFSAYPATIDSEGAHFDGADWLKMASNLLALFQDNWATGFTVYWEIYNPAQELTANTDNNFQTEYPLLYFTNNASTTSGTRYFKVLCDHANDGIYFDMEGTADYFAQTDAMSYEAIIGVAATVGLFSTPNYLSGIAHEGIDLGTDTDSNSLTTHIASPLSGWLMGWEDSVDWWWPTGTRLRRLIVYPPQPTADLPSISSTGLLP
jgi:hypothetical protein